eukprot:2712275-Pyramimonas_sp.AAC.1
MPRPMRADDCLPCERLWRFNTLAAGAPPECDHNLEPSSNELRSITRGFQLTGQGLCGALCEYRADLLEMGAALGFNLRDHVSQPCFCCNARKGRLFSPPPTFDTCKWMPKDSESHSRALSKQIRGA